MQKLLVKSRTGFRLSLNTLTDGENPSAFDDAGYDTILGAASLRFLQGCGFFLDFQSVSLETNDFKGPST